MGEFASFGSSEYLLVFSIFVFARGMDFLSTWIATPNLVLEANPIARRMGWKVGIGVNLLLAVLFAFWPLPAIVIITSSLLVASRNFQSAWMMRSLGEDRYRCWMADCLGQTSLGLYLFCLLAQTLLISFIGMGLVFFSGARLVPFAIGVGIITYSFAVMVFTLVSVWHMRRSPS